MNLIHGIHHKRTLEDILISVFQVAIVTMILFIVALVAADAWMKEDIARVAKLKQHVYEVAYGRATMGPAAPTGVRPNYGESSEPKPTDKAKPKVTYFQDASVKAKGGK